MSLISDALKKAQQERGSEPESGIGWDDPLDDQQLPPEPPEPKRPRSATEKRMIFYGVALAVVLVGIVLATVVFKPEVKSGMKALNTNQNQPAFQARQTPPQTTTQQPAGTQSANQASGQDSGQPSNQTPDTSSTNTQQPAETQSSNQATGQDSGQPSNQTPDTSSSNTRKPAETQPLIPKVIRKSGLIRECPNR